MSHKFKLAGILTIFLLLFQVIPAIAKDLSAAANNDQTMYQQLLAQEKAAPPPTVKSTEQSENKQAKNLLESLKLSGNAGTSDFYEVEPNDSMSTADTIQFNQLVHGTITDVYYDLDYFKLNVTNSGELTVLGTMGNYSQTENSYFGMALLDHNGNPLNFSSMFNDSSNYGQMIDVQNLQAGTYYVVAFQSYEGNYYVGEPYSLLATMSTTSNTNIDLVPYQPNDWGDKLVITKNQGQLYSDTSFTPNDSLYVDYAYTNTGTTTTPNATFTTKIYVDNNLAYTGGYQGTIEPDSYIYGKDKSIGKLSPGTHTIKMVVDASNAVAETNENNNEYSSTITVSPDTSDVDLVPYQPNSWGDKLIVTKNQGQLYSDTSFTPNDSLYVNYAYTNTGTATTPNTTVTTKIYVDNNLAYTGGYQGTIEPGSYIYARDKSIGDLTAGTHTIKMVVDASNAVTETNENNNEYSVSIYVSPTDTTVHPTSVSLNKPSTTLVTGTTEQLIATVLPTNATNQNVTWSSDNPSVASVDSDGLVTANSPGNNVNITATTVDGNLQASCNVTVTAATKTVQSLSADPSSLALTVGDIGHITLTATYTDGTTEDVTGSANWTSSKPTVASIQFDGSQEEVTALAAGSTTLTASYSGKRVTCNVTVTATTKTVQSLSADPSSLDLAIDETGYITLTATYSDGTTDDVTEAATWTSSKPSVASLQFDGSQEDVTALAAGSTTITASYNGKKTTILTTVTDNSGPSITDVAAQPDTVDISVGQTQTVKIYALYDDNTQVDVTKSVTLESDDETVATVKGATIKGVGAGYANITGTYYDSNSDYYYDVTITVNVSDSSPAQSYLTVQPSSVSIPYGKTQKVTINAVDENDNTTNVTSKATLVSNDPTIATVTGSTIKGICVGSTTVTATYQDMTVDFDVTVTPPVTKLTADPATMDICIDDTNIITLTAIFKGETEGVEVDPTQATWQSSNQKIATVDEYGTVTGVAKGSATIKASFGGKTLSIKVNVYPPINSILVQPNTVGIAKGKTQAVKIYAIFDDGSDNGLMVDISKNVKLTSDDTDIATVSGTTIKGIQADCDTTVSGSYLGQDIEIPVYVTPPLKTLVEGTGTKELDLSLDAEDTLSLTATYNDGTEEDVSDRAVAVSSKSNVAAVIVSDGCITVTGKAAGTTTVTLSYEGKKVTVKVVVSN